MLGFFERRFPLRRSSTPTVVFITHIGSEDKMFPLELHTFVTAQHFKPYFRSYEMKFCIYSSLSNTFTWFETIDYFTKFFKDALA